MPYNSIAEILARPCTKIIISKPRRAGAAFKKITLIKTSEGYNAEKLTEKQAFHESVSAEMLYKFCNAFFTDYAQLNAWHDGLEYSVLISKNGKISIKKVKCNAQMQNTSLQHNREKNYIIKEGMEIPALVDMGVFTKEGKIVASMYDKFKQINRFIEIIDDAAGNGTQPLNIIDFGCGKSYLTFLIYYYFTDIKKREVNIIGLDLKADVINKCNVAAERYGYKGLKFEIGDINGYSANSAVDMVITLHACDTATDYALFNAVNWKAKMIFSVPCCQHELNGQLKAEKLNILSRYGIIKERFSALATDAIRANLLMAAGYKTQVLEFVDLTHTPKNLLLRAVRSGVSQEAKQKALREAQELINEFAFEPTLMHLLQKNKLI